MATCRHGGMSPWSAADPALERYARARSKRSRSGKRVQGFCGGGLMLKHYDAPAGLARASPCKSANI